jgi:hypothetical protein
VNKHAEETLLTPRNFPLSVSLFPFPFPFPCFFQWTIRGEKMNCWAVNTIQEV